MDTKINQKVIALFIQGESALSKGWVSIPGKYSNLLMLHGKIVAVKTSRNVLIDAGHPASRNVMEEVAELVPACYRHYVPVTRLKEEV